MNPPYRAPAPRDFSVVIPVHNEAAIIEGSIRELHARLNRSGRSYEIILAENGSRDETSAIGEDLVRSLENVQMIHLHEANYGAALRAGILQATGRTIHCDEIDICDADFHRRALELLTGDDGGFELVVGSKAMSGARDGRPLGRRVATRVLNGLLRGLFGFQGTDTHGLKAFRRDALVPLVEQCRIERDLFASELVIRAERAGIRIVEIPLKLREKREPSIRLSQRVPGVLRDLTSLFYAIRIQDRLP